MATLPVAPGTPLSSSGRSSSKSSKPTRRIVLHLASRLLERFPSSLASTKLPKPSPGTPASLSAAVSQDPDSPSATGTPEHAATPIPDNDAENAEAAPIAPNGRRKPGPAPRGIKRGAPGSDPNGVVKPRGKPGPKRRRRPEDEQAEDGSKGAWTGPNPAAGQKLGPKANQGAINAGLRALDRTGTKCRRWERKSYELKSFTGVMWIIPQWSTPKLKESSAGELKTEITSSNDGKAEGASSAIGSASSQADGEVNGNGPVALPSSPPAAQTPATATAA